MVIVVSILLAFGIDTWWAGTQERHLAATYVSRVERDVLLDIARWRDESAAMVQKQASLDRALAWLRSPDFADAAVRDFLEDLTSGAQRSYGLGIVAERSAFDELISTGSFQLLGAELGEAVRGYHRSVDFSRARHIARETTYAARVYELTPRAPDSDASVRTDLTAGDRERIARRALVAALEGPLVAERNLSQLREALFENLLDEAATLLDLVRVRDAF